ncbi:peptidase inhibitor family I36 protein [Streptomyces hawaiiensis]|uniref:peptidase inhibitor family I36 protein n=1 Tax=Streptomyces hawaiiensis TaxID=67305 RepID=UPI0036473BBB
MGAPQASAQAAPGEGEVTALVDYTWCVDDAFCIFENTGYTGSAFRSGYDTPNVGEVMNDKMTSLWNRTDKYVCLYRDSWYRNHMLPLAQIAIGPGQSMANVNRNENDVLTSFRFSDSYACD